MAKSDLIRKYNQPPPASAVERAHQVPHHTHLEGLPRLGVGIRPDDLKLDIVDRDVAGGTARIRQIVEFPGGTGSGATTLYVLQLLRCDGTITSGEFAAIHGELETVGETDFNAADPVYAGVFGEVTAGSTGDSTPHLCGVGARAVMTDGDGTAKISGIYIAQPDIASGKADESYGLYIDRQATSGATTKYALLTQSGQVTFNEAGHNGADFRIKSSGSTAMFLVDAGTNTCKIGTGMGANYAQFAVDGELTLAGTARVTKSKYLPADSWQPDGANATVATLGISSVVQYADNAVGTAYGSFEIPDDIDLSEDVDIILHWSSPAMSLDCSWRVVYLPCAADDDMTGAGTAVNNTAGSSATANGYATSTHTIATGNIAAGDEVLLVSVIRLGNALGDTLSNVANLTGVSMEYTANTLGTAT